MDDTGIPLGYAFNPGGLNNQRVALAGLVLEGLWQKKAITLPGMYNLDHAGGLRDIVRFDCAYDLKSFMRFSDRSGLRLSEARPLEDTPEASWPFFGAGATHVAATTAAGTMTPDDVCCDFFRSLVPVIRADPEFERLRCWVFGELAVDLVIQMRIESDWRLFSAITLQPTVGAEEDFLPSFGQILTKVRNTFGDTAGSAYVVCDEASLGEDIEEIRRVGRETFGIELHWKSDLLGKDFTARRTVLERSMFDFEIVTLAQRFVGLTRSSFSNMATFQRYCLTRAQVSSHYVYNIPGDLLHERHDNGAYAFAGPAIATPDAALKLLSGGC